MAKEMKKKKHKEKTEKKQKEKKEKTENKNRNKAPLAKGICWDFRELKLVRKKW